MSLERSRSPNTEAITAPAGSSTDSLQLEWEHILSEEGLPAEPDQDPLISLASTAIARHSKVSRASRLHVKEQPSSDAMSNPLEVAEQSDLRELSLALLDTLPDRQAGVMRLRYGFGTPPMSQARVGDIYGVTRTRIQQIEADALMKLRHPDYNSYLRAYRYDEDPEEPSQREHRPSDWPEKTEQFKQAVQSQLIAACYHGSVSMSSIRDVSKDHGHIENIIDSTARFSGVSKDHIRRLLTPFYQSLLSNSTQRERQPGEIYYDELYRSVLDVLKTYP